MTDADAFLAAILAAPDDDAPRLEFADWLDENGQPERAEFIRVQCAIEKRRAGPAGPVPDDSPWLQGDSTYQALRRRERELLAAACGSQVEWASPSVHRLMVAGVEWVSHLPWFRRGFVAAITCAAADWLAHGDRILAAQPVEEVTLTTFPPMDERFSPDGFAEYRLRRRGVWVGIDDDRGGLQVGEYLLRAEWPRVKTWRLPDRRPLGRNVRFQIGGDGHPVIPNPRTMIRGVPTD